MIELLDRYQLILELQEELAKLKQRQQAEYKLGVEVEREDATQRPITQQSMPQEDVVVQQSYDNKMRLKLEQELRAFIKKQKALTPDVVYRNIDANLAWNSLVKLQTGNKELLWCMKIYCEPFITRFWFHFGQQQQQSARLDKPEWWIDQVLKWIADHSNYRQWQLQNSDRQQQSLLHDFISVMLQECLVKKAQKDISIIMKAIDTLDAVPLRLPTSTQDGQWTAINLGQEKLHWFILLSHLVRECVRCDDALKNQYSVQSQLVQISVLQKDSTKASWLSAEDQLIQHQQDIIMAQQPWLRMYKELDSDDDAFQVPRCAVLKLDLISDFSALLESLQSCRKDLQLIIMRLFDRFVQYLEQQIQPMARQILPLKQPPQLGHEEMGNQTQFKLQAWDSSQYSTKSILKQFSKSSDDSQEMIIDIPRWLCSMEYILAVLKVWGLKDVFVLPFDSVSDRLEVCIQQCRDLLAAKCIARSMKSLEQLMQRRNFHDVIEPDDKEGASRFAPLQQLLDKSIVVVGNLLKTLNDSLPFDLKQRSSSMQIISNCLCKHLDWYLFMHCSQCSFSFLHGAPFYASLLQQFCDSITLHLQKQFDVSEEVLKEQLFPRTQDCIRLLTTIDYDNLLEGPVPESIKSLSESSCRQIMKRLV